MRRSNFKRPKTVLVFNGAQVLVAVIRSLHSAAELTKGNLQAISFCCTGKYVCSGGLYFRHLHPNVEVGLDDLDYSVRQMAHKREAREKKKNDNEQEKR